MGCFLSAFLTAYFHFFFSSTERPFHMAAIETFIRQILTIWPYLACCGQGGGGFPSPRSPSFLSPINHPLGRNIYLSQPSSALRFLEEELSVRLPKIRLHCRLDHILRENDGSPSSKQHHPKITNKESLWKKITASIFGILR